METDADLNERQSRIFERVQEQGFVTIDALARDFSVSAQTVRREIIRLDELGLLQRFHGGAGRREAATRLSYEKKQTLEAERKRAIGLAMAAEIEDGQTIFLDVGTTAEATAIELISKNRLIVMTSSMASARVLGQHSNIEVFLTGGRLAGPDGSLAGPSALQSLSSYRFDWAIIACSGFDEVGTVLDFDADKIEVKKLAMRLARRRALIVDASKFARTARAVIAPISEFDLIVSDEAPAGSLSEAIGASGAKFKAAK